jgi:hypothetical protein
MPTPNEQDEEVYALLLSNKGRCADLATYREEIIASEREAAADRLEALRPTALRLGGYDVIAIDSGKTAVLSGQSASPKEELHSPGEVVIYASGDPCPRCGTPLGRVGLNSDNWHIVCPHCPADFGDANGPDGKAHNDGMSPEVITYYEQAEKDEYPEPVTPLQEARDRGNEDHWLEELLARSTSVIGGLKIKALMLEQQYEELRKRVDPYPANLIAQHYEARAALAAEGKAP